MYREQGGEGGTGGRGGCIGNKGGRGEQGGGWGRGGWMYREHHEHLCHWLRFANVQTQTGRKT